MINDTWLTENEASMTALKVGCIELGVQGCDFSAGAETPGEVLRQVVEHVQDQHHITLPPADEILTGKAEETLLPKNAQLVVKRLREQLNLVENGALAAEEPPVIVPPSG